MDTKQLIEWSAKYHTPNYGRTPIVLVRGEGSRVWDSDGKEYLDFTSGIAVTSLGHCHPVVTGAIREAAATLLHVSNIFNNAPQVHLAKLLVEHSFADRVFFCNSGAEANEAAFKIARKYARTRWPTIATRSSPPTTRSTAAPWPPSPPPGRPSTRRASNRCPPASSTCPTATWRR